MSKLLVILISTSTLGVLYFWNTGVFDYGNLNRENGLLFNSKSECFGNTEVYTFIDASGSITEEGFEEIKIILADIADKINEDLRPLLTNTFIIEQGFYRKRGFNINSPEKKDDVKEFIDKTDFSSTTKGTDLCKNALDQIEFQKKKMRVLIYFSDGHYSENDKSDILKEVNSINTNYDPYVFVLATSDQYSLSKLRIFCHHDCVRNVMVLDDFRKIYDYINDISQKVCQTDLFQNWG